MKKMFSLQKKFVPVFIVTVVITFIYALGFMTPFKDLYGFEYPKNNHIIDFHDVKLQGFNQTIFWIGVVTLPSIIALFALQVNKKVCDRLALIIMGVFSVVIIGLSIFGIVTLISLFPEYKALDMTYFFDEKSFDYEKTYYMFYFGYVIYGLAIISTITSMTVFTLNHFKFMKLHPIDVKKEKVEKDNSKKVEVGANNV